MIADDFKEARDLLERIGRASWVTGDTTGHIESSAALEALERIRLAYEKKHQACYRLTELANKHAAQAEALRASGRSLSSREPHNTADAIRNALGDAYLGGPLL